MKSDLELVAEFRRGDSTAFAKLIRRHQLSLFNFFYALVQCESLAEHLTQETFIHVVTDRQAISSKIDFNITLLRAASQCWLSFAGRMNESSSLEIVPPNTERPSLESEAARAFNSLPRPLMLVLVLCDTCGLSYGEVAQVLELPEAGIRNRMNEAYRRMRNQMITRMAALGQ